MILNLEVSLTCVPVALCLLLIVQMTHKSWFQKRYWSKCYVCAYDRCRASLFHWARLSGASEEEESFLPLTELPVLLEPRESPSWEEIRSQRESDAKKVYFAPFSLFNEQQGNKLYLELHLKIYLPYFVQVHQLAKVVCQCMPITNTY